MQAEDIERYVQNTVVDGPVLRVCAAENEMPYSNKQGEGFENKLTRFMGAKLNRKIEYVYWKDPRYYVRDFLQKGRCDVAVGVDTGDPRVATTIPYYRSGYVFISREQDDLALQNWDSEVLRRAKRIGFIPGTPSEVMLKKIGRYHDMFNYNKELVGFKSRRNQYVKYEPVKLVDDVADGKAEVAVLWGPSAARYVQEANTPLKMTVIPDNNTRSDGRKVGFHYSTSMAVRKDDSELLEQLNQFIQQNQGQITAVLEQEGIPLLPVPETELALNSQDNQ
ncbi:methanol oxidation system protein MoxJ [Methylomarinum sp. Ch1-1]|uniref:Methanol oxidation system protein MoxJ n=1 Tax=Methylomarinum roseum TaxID=3067653 RepID=A0AAU7NYY1_9GAMM|nr:methanol oxidation system protein MoxJ [Methylomarinum sp. Ch1-1]MDP4521726.1 methanol oxidation system protein MoxJ [Methylomarinum sp. Ch1-1]